MDTRTVREERVGTWSTACRPQRDESLGPLPGCQFSTKPLRPETRRPAGPTRQKPRAGADRSQPAAPPGTARMTDELTALLVRGTAAASALAFLAASRAAWLPRGSTAAGSNRWWIAAWLLLALHTAAAYHFVHRWSHPAAAEHTAVVTERVTGWRWGGGIWFNYAFLGLGGVDLLVLKGVGGRSTPRAFHVIALFMVFNATLVFGSWWWAVPWAVWGICVWRDRGLSEASPPPGPSAADASRARGRKGV